MVEGFRYIHEKLFIDRYLLTLQNLSKEVCIVLVVEGRVSAEQDVGDHSDAPHVHRLAVRLLGEHLGRHVARRAARRGHHARLLHLGQPEVADHDLAVRVGAATTIELLGNVLSKYWGPVIRFSPPHYQGPHLKVSLGVLTCCCTSTIVRVVGYRW